ncbi:GTP cyclohydrolase II [Sporobolomyces salmoneus]|uniref:GTP cyclohydrolase II n=1 Tax=Sporobolomyces salmoneus TaxID=183962 RepID=UPI00316CC98B
MTALHGGISQGDLDVLSLLTRDAPTGKELGNSSNPASLHLHQSNGAPKRKKQSYDRRPPVEPLMVAAAASAGPDNTRNHFLHSFFPRNLAYSSCDGERLPISSATSTTGTTTGGGGGGSRPKMESRQAPRHIRLLVEEEERKRKQVADQLRQEEIAKKKGTLTAEKVPKKEETEEEKEEPQKSQVKSLREQALAKLLRQPSTPPLLEKSIDFPIPPPLPFSATAPSAVEPEQSSPATSSVPSLPPKAPLPPLQVQCRVRTRIPTPHGHVFLHLYTNNHDDKEHLAFVADHAQMASTSVTTNAVVSDSPIVLTRSESSNRPLPFIRSRSLDSKWHGEETDEERIIRGAYVGRLSASSQIASTALGPLEDYISTPPSPSLSSGSTLPPTQEEEETTTTIDSPLVRIHSECFTGETIGSQRCDCGEQLDEAFRLITSAGRGVVVYLRQEGRGIGLLEKMRAYNLQDLGHDTVTANLMLGHGADLRTYGIAGAILRDLGIAGEEKEGKGGVRLLTNNPDKITQIEKEGVRVAERVAMAPRSWILAEREEARRRKHRNSHRHHLGGGTSKPKDGKKRRHRRKESGLESSVASIPSTVDSEEIPSAASSVPLSVDPSRSPSPSRASDDDYSSYSSSDDSGSEDEDGRSESSAMYNLRHSGVGMIGRSTTASPELDKYLRTKIERMGHMLVAPPDASSSTSTSTSTTSRKKSAHPLSESTTSLSNNEGER